MAGVREHTELEAWKLADALRLEVLRLTAGPSFRPARHRDLLRQLDSSAQSACANIAEGFARYRPADFARFLRMARGSLAEVMEHLTGAVTRGLLTEADIAAAISFAKRARGACTRLIRYLESAHAPGLD